MSTVNENKCALINSFNELNVNQHKHKQFSSLDELNSFLKPLFNLIRIVKGFEDIRFVIYGGAIRDLILEKPLNDIDISLFYRNYSKVFRSDELHSKLQTISEFSEKFCGFKINIERPKQEYSLLKMYLQLPDNLFVNIDITSFCENKSCDFTVNNLQYQSDIGLYTIVNKKYDVIQSLKDINTKTLRFVSDIKSLKFCERTNLINRSNKMIDKGFKYDINELEKDPYLDISNEKKICPICQCDDNKDKKYYLCSTCNASYHLNCANTYILSNRNNNRSIETINCPSCRQ